MPPMQPMQPIQPAGPQYPSVGAPGPMLQQVQLPPAPKRDVAGLVKTIVIVILTLALITFIGLFIWMMMQYDDARTDVDGQIERAVLDDRDEQSQKMEAEFMEREKYPYKTFTGPVDYGALSFQYPKTWSVYIEAAATKGGDFKAYLNPNQVDAVGKDTINALRVVIQDRSFDDVTAGYQGAVNNKQDPLVLTSITTGKNNNIVANRYDGPIPGTQLRGSIVIFKIRDKTVILQTDSELFRGDFDKLLTTVEFNE